MRSLVCMWFYGYRVHRRALVSLFPCSRCAAHIPFPENVGTHPRSFSHEADSSSEFLRLNRCSHLSVGAIPAGGFCPLRDITTVRLLARGFPGPR